MSDNLHDILEVGQSRQAFSKPAKLKYPALRAISQVYKCLAVVTVVFGVLGLLVVVFADIPGAIKAQIALPLIVYLVLGPVFLWGTAELILLLMDIESNTKRTCEALDKTDRHE